MTPAGFHSVVSRSGAPLSWRTKTGTGVTQSPPTVTGSVTLAAATAGATALAVRAGYAIGRLIAGDKIAIAGTAYTVTNPVSATSNVFTSVPITPALAADIAVGSAVTLTFAADTSVTARVAEYTAKELIGGVQAGDMRAIVAAQGCSVTPAIGHEAIIDGATYRVLSISRKTWGAATLGWECQLRK